MTGLKSKWLETKGDMVAGDMVVPKGADNSSKWGMYVNEIQGREQREQRRTTSRERIDDEKGKAERVEGGKERERDETPYGVLRCTNPALITVSSRPPSSQVHRQSQRGPGRRRRPIHHERHWQPGNHGRVPHAVRRPRRVLRVQLRLEAGQQPGALCGLPQM